MTELPAGDRASYRLLDILDGTHALRAEFRHRRFRPHFHDTYVIGATEQGAEIFEARGGRHVSPAGSLRLINPGEVHTGAPPRAGVWGYRCLYPSVSLMAGIAAELGRSAPPFFPDMVVPHPALAAMLLRALAGAEGPASRLGREAGLRVALAQIVVAQGAERPEIPPVRREPQAVERARRFITDHLAQDIGLAEVAQAAGMSRFHLLRVFKAETGLTPFAFQAHARVVQARSLLGRGLSVKQTAAACGFVDRSHFARVFLATVGVTPATYRDAVAPTAPRVSKP